MHVMGGLQLSKPEKNETDYMAGPNPDALPLRIPFQRRICRSLQLTWRKQWWSLTGGSIPGQSLVGKT